MGKIHLSRQHRGARAVTFGRSGATHSTLLLLLLMPPRAARLADGGDVWAKASDLAAAHAQVVGTLQRLFPTGYVGKWLAGRAVRSDGQIGVLRGWCGSLASTLRCGFAGRTCRLRAPQQFSKI